jgi:LysM repeat protein
VPAGARAVFLERYAALPPEERLTWAHHVVRRGETLATIARQHGSSVSAIMAANKLKSANRIGVGWSLLVPTGSSADAVARAAPSGVASAASDGDAQAPAPRPGPHSYRVRPGDTLTSIAQRFGTTVSRLADWNGLSNTNRIRVGQRLVVSRGTSAAAATAASRQTHVVKRGDTLSAIARAYATTVHELREWNNLSHASTIHPGERLTILAR